MTVSISNENKNTASTVTNESKPSSGGQWSDRAITWEESGAAGDTWDVPGNVIAKESKNSASTVTNESKT